MPFQTPWEKKRLQQAAKAEQERLAQQARQAEAQRLEQARQDALKSWRDITKYDGSKTWQVALAKRIRAVVVELKPYGPGVSVDTKVSNGMWQGLTQTLTYTNRKVLLTLRDDSRTSQTANFDYRSSHSTDVSISVYIDGQEVLVYKDSFHDAKENSPASFFVWEFTPGAWVDYILGDFAQQLARENAQALAAQTAAQQSQQAARQAADVRKAEELKKRLREKM